MSSAPPLRSPYRIHGFDFSYFTSKVRPAFRYKGVWHEEVRADYGEIRRRTGLGFIPMVVTPDDETWQDSTDIYDRLEARHPEPPLFPATPVQRVAAALVELYTDEFGTLPAMHYRWGTAEGEATARARFSAAMGSLELGQRSGDAMVQARAMLGSTPQTGPVIEAHLRDLLDALCAHFDAYPYLCGERMSVADCAMMGPFYGHLFTDIVSRRLLLDTAWQVVGWIDRCHTPDAAAQDDWLADDALAPTLREVLRVMGEDAAPLILDVARSAEAGLEGRPGEALPRATGMCETSLRGQPVPRAAIAYTLWMLQRTLDAYRGLDEPARKRVDSALAGTGWEPLLAHEPRHRLTRRGFEIVIADAD